MYTCCNDILLLFSHYPVFFQWRTNRSYTKLGKKQHLITSLFQRRLLKSSSESKSGFVSVYFPDPALVVEPRMNNNVKKTLMQVRTNDSKAYTCSEIHLDLLHNYYY